MSTSSPRPASRSDAFKRSNSPSAPALLALFARGPPFSARRPLTALPRLGRNYPDVVIQTGEAAVAGRLASAFEALAAEIESEAMR